VLLFYTRTINPSKYFKKNEIPVFYHIPKGFGLTLVFEVFPKSKK